MIRWKCPKCGATVECIASQVTHRCPSNQNRPTDFVEDNGQN